MGSSSNLYYLPFSGLSTQRIIHVSTRGKDSPNCGQSTNNKCKSVNYALSNIHHNSSTIVLESHPTRQIVYKCKQYTVSEVGHHVRFEKDNKTNRNPSISISFTLYQRIQEAINITVEFKSVNVIGKVQLFDISKRHRKFHNRDINVRLFLTDALITKGKKENSFVNIFDLGYVDIVIRNCRFLGSRPKKWFKLHSNNAQYPLNITIENSRMQGIVFLEMVNGIAHLKNNIFRYINVPRGGSLLNFRDSTVTMDSCRFLDISLSQHYEGPSEIYDTRFKFFYSKQNAFVVTGTMTLPCVTMFYKTLNECWC